jgi:hypothetical protein
MRQAPRGAALSSMSRSGALQDLDAIDVLVRNLEGHITNNVPDKIIANPSNENEPLEFFHR